VILNPHWLIAGLICIIAWLRRTLSSSQRGLRPDSEVV
jgi:hypothetical protein